MREKNKSTFKCLVSVGGCRLWLIVMYTCCDGSSHQTGPVTHHVLCPGPTTSVSAGRLHLIQRVLLCNGHLCSRSGKSQEVNSLVSSHQ